LQNVLARISLLGYQYPHLYGYLKTDIQNYGYPWIFGNPSMDMLRILRPGGRWHGMFPMPTCRYLPDDNVVPPLPPGNLPTCHAYLTFGKTAKNTVLRRLARSFQMEAFDVGKCMRFLKDRYDSS